MAVGKQHVDNTLLCGPWGCTHVVVWHAAGHRTRMLPTCACTIAAMHCPVYCVCCPAGGNYSGAFVNEFKIFVAELRDFFNAVGLTQLLDGVKNGMSAEDQQVRNFCGGVGECPHVCVGGGGAAGGMLAGDWGGCVHQSLAHSQSHMHSCLALSRVARAPRTNRCVAAAVPLGRGVLILGEGGALQHAGQGLGCCLCQGLMARHQVTASALLGCFAVSRAAWGPRTRWCATAAVPVGDWDIGPGPVSSCLITFTCSQHHYSIDSSYVQRCDVWIGNR
jgi:hypothetical protein